MKKLLFTLLTLCILAFTSCSSEDIENPNNSSIVGVWELTAWNVVNGFDFNNDGIISTNLLNEINCTKEETLVFEANSVVSLNTTFKPDIEIAQSNSINSEYSFNINCDTDGVVSLATSYTFDGNNIVFGETIASIDGNQITIVFMDTIEIYNEDVTEVIETRDLTLVYTKQ